MGRMWARVGTRGGGVVSSFGAMAEATKKIKNILCLGLKWPSNRRLKCNNQQKTSAFNGEGMEHDVRAAGSMGGARFDRFHGDHVM